MNRPAPTPRAGWRRLVVLCLVALAGCRTLPAISTEDLAPRAGPPQVAGARGPLSPERSREVLEALKRRAPDTGLLDRHLALEEALAGRPLVAGNRVTLLQDGAATYRAMLAAIAQARDHIHLESYIFEDDEVGRRFTAALVDRQRAGVAVSLIVDGIGALGTPREFFRPLLDAGGRVLEFNPVNPLVLRVPWNVNERDHRKLMVVDGRIAFLGGINISSVYSGGSLKSGVRKQPNRPWRDTHVQVEGPVVADYQRMFLDTWQKQRGEPLPTRDFYPTLAPRGKELVRAIAGSPDEPVSAIYATLISAIENAESEVWMTNAYFAPDPQLREALKAAVRRGVDVKLILPSATDSNLIFHAGRSYYDELLEAGVRIYERRHVLLHSKTVVIDGVWSTVGSTNLDWRSALHNQEVNAVVLGAEFAQQMRAVFERDLAASEPITLQAWQQRGVRDRLKQRLARMLEYWL